MVYIAARRQYNFQLTGRRRARIPVIVPYHPKVLMLYRADITAGALKLPESRVVAGMLLRGAENGQWPPVQPEYEI